MKSEEKMSTIAFAGGLCCAIFVDIVGVFIPVIGTAFIGFMKFTFWIARYDLKNTGVMTIITALLEGLPVVPGCTVFMISSFVQNRKNVEAREKKKKEAEKSAAEQKIKKQRFAQEQAMRRQIAMQQEQANAEQVAMEQEQMMAEQFAMQEQGA
jgi:hypothetical protein